MHALFLLLAAGVVRFRPEGDEAIFVINITGQNQRKLTGGGAHHPAWRPRDD